MSRRSKVAMLVMAAFVAFVEGPLNPFWLWNALPIGVAYLVLRSSFDNRKWQVPGVVFAVLCCVAVVLTHILWMLDVGGLATSGATAGLVLMVAPVYAFALGGLGLLITAGVNRRSRDTE